MPYKLRDPGVVLRHEGPATMLDGGGAEVLEVTFEGVGLTPDNRYRVYVADDSGLIEQWDVYGDRDDPRPSLQVPWRDWQPYGGVLLSGNRGERRITGIAVFDELPPGTFDAPEPFPGGSPG
jgi:hypothetical protein